MAATGLYEDGKKGIRRVSDPHLRVLDMDRDGVQAEVMYGIWARRRASATTSGHRDVPDLQ